MSTSRDWGEAERSLVDIVEMAEPMSSSYSLLL